MVGVGVAEGGTGPGGGEQYYGEYYPPEQYYVPQEMCAHPQQHPQHAHMCTVHADYGGMPVVTSATMMPPMMPAAVMDENMRHYLVHAPHPPPHAHHAHHQPQHHQPPPPPPPHHHQPQHYHGATNGAGGPQHYFNAGYPAHYHLPPQHMPAPHFQPPPVYQKDERALRQYSKLKHKLERKQYNNRNNGTGESLSGASTPSLSPRKELNGSRGASSGARSEGESSSASASLHGDDEHDTQALLDLLSATRTPQVSEVSPTTALVQWNTPLPEGLTLPSVELTYELLLGDRGRYRAIYSGPKLSCWVCDLRPGCEYSVCLQVRAGELTATSEAATFRAPPAPPGAPPPPRLASRTRASLVLRWAAAADNGARVSHYLVELDDGGGGGWREVARPRSRQHCINELRPQTRHRLRLAAVNECGRGEWSDEIVAWTTGAPPPAPPPPRLVCAAPQALTLAWDARAPYDEYTLQAHDPARAHGYLPVYSGPDLEATCSDLRRATDYRFRLRCENADGQGPWSVETTYRTLPEPPAPPARPALRGKAHARSLRLRWEPPADDGGAPVDEYTLELDDGAGFREAYCGAEREAYCDRLRPGTSYRARVNCRTVAGTSDWSAVESVATEAAVPAACAAPEPAAPPRALHAAIRWRAPDCTGGADVTEYRIELTDAAGAARVLRVPDTECTLRDLAPGAAYSVAVAACNRVGSGPLSEPLRFAAAAAPPDAPGAPAVEVCSAHSALLRWEPPRDNGSPVLDYRLEVSKADVEDSFCEVFRGLATERLVADLTPFTAYFFRVCASNAAGRGAWSPPRDCLTPRAPPAAPPLPRCEPEASALRVTWRAPATHGAPLQRYRVRVDERELAVDAAETECRVDGLAPDTVYRVRVAAENELGLGAWSEAARAATRPPPPLPPRLACVQRAHNHLKLKWGEGGATDGTQYRLEMRAPDSREFRAAYRGSARCCKVKKLREATTYAFRIRASDERGGLGDWSEPLEESTCAAPPPAPRAPHVEPGPGSGRATVTWDSSDDCTYAVQLCRSVAGASAAGAGGAPPAWRQAWAGGGGQCPLEELEAGAEYLVRVCAWRDGAAGAWSPPARLALPAASAAGVSSGPGAARRGARPARRSLARRHAALLLAVGFLALAVGVAWLLQRLVSPRP